MIAPKQDSESCKHTNTPTGMFEQHPYRRVWTTRVEIYQVSCRINTNSTQQLQRLLPLPPRTRLLNFERVTRDSLHAHNACSKNEAHTRADGHRSLMTLSILFTTSLLMASSSGRGEMKLKKSIISSWRLKSKQQNTRDHEQNIGSKISWSCDSWGGIIYWCVAIELIGSVSTSLTPVLTH